MTSPPRPADGRLAYLAWSVVVLTAFVAPGSLTPPGPEALASLDKVVHLLLVFVHAVLGGRFLSALGVRRAALAGAGIALAWSLALELVQQWVPGRSASADDALADFAGAALGGLWVRLAGRTRVAVLRRSRPASAEPGTGPVVS